MANPNTLSLKGAMANPQPQAPVGPVVHPLVNPPIDVKPAAPVAPPPEAGVADGVMVRLRAKHGPMVNLMTSERIHNESDKKVAMDKWVRAQLAADKLVLVDE